MGIVQEKFHGKVGKFFRSLSNDPRRNNISNFVEKIRMIFCQRMRTTVNFLAFYQGVPLMDVLHNGVVNSFFYVFEDSWCLKNILSERCLEGQGVAEETSDHFVDDSFELGSLRDHLLGPPKKNILNSFEAFFFCWETGQFGHQFEYGLTELAFEIE